MPLPLVISITISIALVNALAKLHNFCIDRRTVALPTSPSDHHALVTNLNGYINLEVQDNCEVTLPAHTTNWRWTYLP